MGLSKQIFVALVAGVAVGLFFGDKVAGFGSMKREDARLLASRGGLLLVALWGLSLGLVFLFPLALPSGRDVLGWWKE